MDNPLLLNKEEMETSITAGLASDAKDEKKETKTTPDNANGNNVNGNDAKMVMDDNMKKDEEEQQEDPIMAQYYTTFNILFMIGYLCHNRKYWKIDVVTNLALLMAYVVYGFRQKYQNYIFLTFLLFVIQTWVWGMPNGANHKNMLGFVSCLLLPQQIQRCWYGTNTKKAQVGTFASLNTMRWSIVIMYLCAGFHKINTDFLYEPSVSCAYDKIHTYMTLFGYDEEEVDYNTELPFLLRILPFTVMIVEIVPAIWLTYPSLQPYAILNFILLHLILLPVGFADFGSIAQSFLYLFVSPEMVVGCGLPGIFFSSMASIFVFFQTVSLSHWYLVETDEYIEEYGGAPPSFTEAECGLVLMGHGLMWCAIFHKYFSNKFSAGKSDDKSTTPLTFGIPMARPGVFGIFALGVFFWFAMNPYLGLRTAGNLTMFSNLRTEGPTSNHLLLGSNPFKIFNYQEDVVEVLEMDERWDYRFEDGDVVPRILFDVGLRSFTTDNPLTDVMMTIRYKGRVIHTDDLCNDPVFATFMDHSYLERKYLNMRVIQEEGPKECSW